MNPEAILALISDLYAQIVALQRERDDLRRQLTIQTPVES